MLLSWALDAFVHRADTHIYWRGVSSVIYLDGPAQQEELFTNYVCALEMFVDLMKRGVIGRVYQEPLGEDSWFNNWEKIEEAAKKGGYTPFTEAMGEFFGSRPPYTITVYSISNDSIGFDFSLGGYKYPLEGLALPKKIFFEFSDRLQAQFRFRTDWSSLDEAKEALNLALRRTTILSVIRDNLLEELSRLSEPSQTTYEAVCASLMRLLERWLREIHKEKGWKSKPRTLNHLISSFERANVFSDNEIQMLRLVSKPYRDYVLHGRQLAAPVVKVLLATEMDLFARLATTLEEKGS